MSYLFCPEHPNVELIEDYRCGDLICPACGLVVGERFVDVSAEWRTLADSCAQNTFNHFDTTLPPACLSPENSYKPVCTKVPEEHFLIQEMGERIHLTKAVLFQAVSLFDDSVAKKCFRGKNREALAAACLYTACRKEHAPRSLKEICAVSSVSKKEIGKCFQLLNKLCGNISGQVSPSDFMSRFCGNLNLPAHVQKMARMIASNAARLDLVAGRSPVSVAATSVYIACQSSNEKHTIKDVAEITGVSHITIKQIYRLFSTHTSKLLLQE